MFTGNRRAYECIIEDKTKDAIYLRLNEQLVIDFQLKHGSEFRVQAQFQLNRDVFCEKHWAVDLCSTGILFPDVSVSPKYILNPCIIIVYDLYLLVLFFLDLDLMGETSK